MVVVPFFVLAAGHDRDGAPGFEQDVLADHSRHRGHARPGGEHDELGVCLAGRLDDDASGKSCQNAQLGLRGLVAEFLVKRGTESPEDIDVAGARARARRPIVAGGAATAVVAALAVLAGVLITRGVLGIPVLAPKTANNFGNSATDPAAVSCRTTFPAWADGHILNPVSPGTTRSADVASSPRGKPREVRHTHLGGTTMSDLIVIGYPDEETAEKVCNELVKLQQDFLVDLEDAAIIRRDQKGRLRVTTPAHHAVSWGTLSGLFWGVLIGLIFLWPLAPVVGLAGGIMGAALGAAGDLGIKDEFRQRAQDILQPGTSAIMVIVRKVTPDKFIEALKPYGGTVLKTSLPYDAEQQLMKALHGDDPSTAAWQQPASAGAQA
jgi:uncharacterized membrane protein